jgi:hypothetical protein
MSFTDTGVMNRFIDVFTAQRELDNSIRVSGVDYTDWAVNISKLDGTIWLCCADTPRIYFNISDIIFYEHSIYIESINLYLQFVSREGELLFCRGVVYE